ncbi:MAG: Ger(x)C family spore germination protein [Bacillota bacterium]
MKRQLKAIILLILILSLTITGCWDRRELEDLALVTGVAIDKAEKPENVRMTAQVIVAQNVSTPGGGGGQGEPVWNGTSTGRTIFDAARKMTFESNQKLYFSHNPVLIIGEEMAKEGIASVMDFFFRDPENRRTTWVLVSKGDAAEILKTKTKIDPIPGMYIKELIELTGATSLVATSMEQGFMERLMSKTTAAYASVIEAQGEGESKKLILKGTAVFNKDKLAGEFDYYESRGLLWVLGKVKSGIINVSCPDSEEQIALEIIRAKGKIIPQIEDNTLKVVVKVNEEGHLGEQECSIDLTTPENWAKLEKMKAGVIRNEILAAVKKAQDLNTDVFGFGDAFHRKYKNIWKSQLKDNWDEFFPDIEVEVVVEAKLRRTGMITKPAVPQ